MLLRTATLFDTVGRPAAPLDAYRAGDTFFVHIDLPGVDPSTIDATVLILRVPVAERARPRKIEIVSRPELANT
jgi:HSP20 family molecular chaperone IbpA